MKKKIIKIVSIMLSITFVLTLIYIFTSKSVKVLTIETVNNKSAYSIGKIVAGPDPIWYRISYWYTSI